MSTATVSHVLNNTLFVSDGIRQRVLAAIEELNYQPSAVARSLRIQSTHTIGLVVSDLELPFFASMARAITDTALNHGFTVITCNTDENPFVEKAHLEMLWKKRVDGLILAATGKNVDLLSKILSAKVPIILVDRRCEGISIPTVCVDNKPASYNAISWLIQQGHKRIAVIAGLKHVSTIQERMDGYVSALKDSGIPVDPSLIKYTDSRPNQAQSVTEELLSLSDWPTAIFSTVSAITLGVLRAFKANNVRCPQEISLLGFDDPDWAEIHNPPITAIRQNPFEVGSKAISILLDMIAGQEAPVENIVINTELVIRGSTSSPRSDPINLRPGTHLPH